jgi:hypothetical protein
MFTFGSLVCIANSRGSFNSFLVDTRELEASGPASHCDIDELADDLGKI